LQAAIVRGSLKALTAEPQRREKLQALIRHAECYLQPSGSQIIPYLIGDNQRAVAMAEAMQNHGFDIRAIRPPTVPLGTARLRISITLNVDEAQITRMAEVLKQIAYSYE
jgi:8-amino-7-oxononanoate synthase